MTSFCHCTSNQTQFSRSVWLPPETWVNVFKFLSRRDLLCHVQPTCRRFHAIAEHGVDNKHVIRNLGQFLDGLEQDLPEANRRFAELSASDVSLAKHFRLDEQIKFKMERQGYYVFRHNDVLRRVLGSSMQTIRRCHAQMCLLRHFLDLFRGCRLHLILHSDAGSGSYLASELLAYLTLLQQVRPFCISVSHATHSPDLHPEPDELLRESAMLSCSRLTFKQAYKNTLSAGSICKWLHHLPTDNGGKEQGNRTRIFNITTKIMPSTCAEIIECCKKLLKQSESFFDQRAFLLNFHCNIYNQVPFRLDHPPTGEVLYLDTFHLGNNDGDTYYHLRRCPIVDLATSDQFYRDTFQEQTFYFRTPVNDGVEAPTLIIQ